MLTSQNLNWIAGIIEGEGCFTWMNGAVISVEMTDKDIIEKLNSFWKTRLFEIIPKIEHYKTKYRIRLHGYKAISWMMTLYCLMGQRRRNKIEEIIQKWKLSPRGAKVNVNIRMHQYSIRKKEADADRKQRALAGVGKKPGN